MHTPKYVTNETFQGSWPAIKAGKTGAPEVITNGGAKAVGKIVFTGNLIAGNTVTVNGVVFTCMASGAAGAVQFNVDSTLTLSLDALVTILNASVNPLVSIATYSKTDTNTALTASFDANGAANNAVVLASNHSTVVVTAPAGGKDTQSISLDAEHTQIIFGSAFTADLTLADGDESQRKTISMMGAGTANISSPTDMLPGATNNYALNGDDVLVMQFLGGKWRLLFSEGAVAT
jgi:hypothetical protein